MRHTNHKTRNTKYAFTLVEVLIVVALIGILAAIILPGLQGHIQKAKESAAKDDLRVLRNTIELYAAQHTGVPPGYLNDDPTYVPRYKDFYAQMVGNGNYLPALPVNPFNEQNTIDMVPNGADFPTEPVMTDLFGWIYQPATKTIKLNWSGTDSKGISYFNY